MFGVSRLLVTLFPKRKSFLEIPYEENLSAIGQSYQGVESEEIDIIDKTRSSAAEGPPPLKRFRGEPNGLPPVDCHGTSI